MNKKSSIIESNTIENQFKIELKDDNNKEQCTDLLIEPIVAVNIDKPIELPPTIATRFLGILYILVSTIFIVTSMFVAKELKVDVLDALIPCYLLQATKQEIFFLFIRAFFSTTGIFAYYLAYRYLPLPDLTTIRYTQIIWTAIITSILYYEKPSISMMIGILLTTIGVIFVVQPTFLFNKISHIYETNISNDSSQRLIGLLIALYSSIALSIMVISNKHLLLKYKTKYSLIMLQYVFIIFCMLIANIFYKYNFFIDKIQSFKNDFFNWRYLCASSICLLHIPALVLVQKAIKREHPSIYTIVQSSAILFSILLQNIFSSTKSNFLSLFGSILVLTSILIITGSKFINGKQDKNKPVQQCSTE
ncbi:unnamed protein product [Rotaria sordida]|uniref:EamA domain-containing protein n=1 Tax=Rotaria sordida TaxID=392033 RepID=A0A819P6I3_9BILA|nr:unnamed protein product [Rotaria sordida]CAF4005640.1 unnamed protein product [Rotaria sordida]